MKKTNQTIYDSLLNNIPNLGKLLFNNDYINPNISSNLFKIWKKSNKIGSNKFKRPSNIPIHDIKDMVKAGLVRNIGENIELTKKGKNIIKVMILGDDRSIFDSDNTIIDYNEALANTKNLKTAGSKKIKISNNKKQGKNWYKKAKTFDKKRKHIFDWSLQCCGSPETSRKDPYKPNKECIESCSVKEAQRARYKGQTQGDESRSTSDSSTEYFKSRAQELSEEIATMRSLFDRALKGDVKAKESIDDYKQNLKEKGYSKNVIEKEIISPAMYKMRL